MTEARVGFLYKIASKLSNTQHNLSGIHLNSFYLMRCHDITRSYGLPTQQFSPNLRCSHCCQEWKEGNYDTVIAPIKLSKKQRRKLRSYKGNVINNVKNSNQMERTCRLCKNTTITTMTKPVKSVHHEKAEQVDKDAQKLSTAQSRNEVVLSKLETKKTTDLNLYSTTKDVFSLKNKGNVLSSKIKETPKAIKNNKKKKDKFAGLCKEAVLASAKLSKEKISRNKLDLFLKPSS